MLLVRDFVAHMASEVVKRLVEGGQIEVKARDAVTTRIRQRMLEELTVEDRLNEEVRQILVERQDEMRSEEHTSELQSRLHLVCRLLLEKKNNHSQCSYAGFSLNLTDTNLTNSCGVLPHPVTTAT